MESTKLKKMMKHIEDVMAAVSFAEEGEFEAAEALFKRERRVLLALKEGRLDAKTLKYALNSAKRISAHLDILYVSAEGIQNQGPDPAFSRFLSELKTQGIESRVIRKTGCLKQEIINYTNQEKDILFAVVESPGSLDADCKEKDNRLSELWRNLKCPLVVVMEEVKA